MRSVTSAEGQIGIAPREKKQKFAHVIKYLVTVDFKILKNQAKFERANPFFNQVIYMNS